MGALLLSGLNERRHMFIRRCEGERVGISLEVKGALDKLTGGLASLSRMRSCAGCRRADEQAQDSHCVYAQQPNVIREYD